MKPGSNMLTKVIYWGSTVIFSLMMAGAAYAYLTTAKMAEAFAHLGFPPYFRVELAIAKFLGVIALLTPVPRLVKEWAYVGFAITLISAIVAHTSVDGIQTAAPPMIALVLVIASYATRHGNELSMNVATSEHSVMTG